MFRDARASFRFAWAVVPLGPSVGSGISLAPAFGRSVALTPFQSRNGFDAAFQGFNFGRTPSNSLPMLAKPGPTLSQLGHMQHTWGTLSPLGRRTGASFKAERL